MRLNWKITAFAVQGREITVVHWPKHDPDRILDVLETKPMRTVGMDPVVAVHSFGHYEVAVRRFSPLEWQGTTALQLFSLLNGTIQARLAVIEMPIALVDDGRAHIIVSIWKPGLRDLAGFFEDKTVSIERKENFCFSFVREIARLHANGFIHGHIALNVFPDAQDHARFVDFTRLRILTESRASFMSALHEKNFLVNLAAMTQMARVDVGQSEAEASAHAEQLAQKLDAEYLRVYGALMAKS